MLLALEEEAALEIHPEVLEVLQLYPGLKLQSHASASTWSLERLDALAAEIKDLVRLSVSSPKAQQLWQQQQQQQQQQHSAESGSDDGSAGSPHDDDGSAGSPHDDDGSAGSPHDDDGSAGSPQGGSSSSLQLPPGLFRSFPHEVIAAINEVLYKRHGYAPCNRYGNIRDTQMSRVLEGGMGCSPVLSILYLVVAQKLGIRMAASLSLEGGRYLVLWPVDHDGSSPLLLSQPQTSSPPSAHQEPNPAAAAAAAAAAPEEATPTTHEAQLSAPEEATPTTHEAHSSAPDEATPTTHEAHSSGDDGLPHSTLGGAVGPAPDTSDSGLDSSLSPAAEEEREGVGSQEPSTTLGGFLQEGEGSTRNSDGSQDWEKGNSSDSSSSGSSSGGGGGGGGGGGASQDDNEMSDSSSCNHTSTSNSGGPAEHSKHSSQAESTQVDRSGDSTGQQQQQQQQLQPSVGPLRERYVIDPYGFGGLLELEEVCELFEVHPEDLLQPATQRQLLAALLARQMDGFFAKATGRSASPATMVPLSIEAALDRKGASLSSSSIGAHAHSRALAAAGKRMALLPNDWLPQVQVALLHFYSRNLDDAYLELACALERQASKEEQRCDESWAVCAEKGPLLLEKIRLELMFRDGKL